MIQPSRYIYIRCSTDHQDYTQQMHTINEYLARMGIGQDKITAICNERVSGTIRHTERKLASLIKSCNNGDFIYVSELSRLGRSMSDLFSIASEASRIGAVIVQCKDGSVIENESISGKALLFALGLAAEIEVANIRQRTRSAIDAIKAKISLGEKHISKSGRVCTKLGRTKGCDTSKATAASAISKQAKAEEWRRNSVGYNAVVRWIREGRDSDFILHEFNANHASNPEDYSTPKGCELTESTLKQWRREIKNMIIL